MELSRFYNVTINIRKPSISTTSTTHAKQDFVDVVTEIPAVKQNSKYFYTIAISGQLAVGLYDFFIDKNYISDLVPGYIIVDFNTNDEFTVTSVFELPEHYEVVAVLKGR